MMISKIVLSDILIISKRGISGDQLMKKGEETFTNMS